MLDFKVSKSDCVRCGQCALECPVGIIEMQEEPKIAPEKEAYCVKCQHCLAVCPTGALSILGKNPADSQKNNFILPDPEAMGEMIKMRRSTRRYKKESLDKELIRELLETASLAPTGHNDNSVQFTVVDDADTMDKLKDLFYASLNDMPETNIPEIKRAYLQQVSDMWKANGVDIMFKDAPHVLIASVLKNCMTPQQDGIIALSYFELLANANGISTLWTDMVKTVIEDINPDLRKSIGIPEDHLIAFTMLFGKPAVKYARSVQPEAAIIQSVHF